MGRIVDPGLQTLADQWSPVVTSLLDALGSRVWPPKKQRQGLFRKPILIYRYSLEGPAQREGKLVWALSHTARPSSFDDRGVLGQGEREFWVITLSPGSSPRFTIQGSDVQPDIPADAEVLREALHAAQQAGPKREVFYGNKGPLSHR